MLCEHMDSREVCEKCALIAMTTYQSRLRALDACRDALDWCAKIPTFTEAWETCPDARWLLWLAFQVLPRRRAVGVLVEVVRATCAHIAPDEVTTEVLNLLAAWAAGDKDVDVEAVCKRAWRIWGTADAAARAAAADAADDAAAAAAWAAAAVDAAARAATAAAAAWAAADAAAAAAWAAAAADATAAAAEAAADAAADAADADDWSAMQAAMIRDLVPYDEVKKMMREVTP